MHTCMWCTRTHTRDAHVFTRPPPARAPLAAARAAARYSSPRAARRRLRVSPAAARPAAP
eukprot:scaffold77192_cov30-Phaeocystis_antarctica.AAC.2